MFGFNTGSVSGSNGVKQQLQTLDFTKLPIPSLASGVSVTVTAARSPTNGGDGLANVGFINATGINLGGI